MEILLAAMGPSGSAVVAINGELKVVDLPRKCWGRHTCCCCPKCQKRNKGKQPVAQTCKCTRPLVLGADMCQHCGRQVKRRAA